MSAPLPFDPTVQPAPTAAPFQPSTSPWDTSFVAGPGKAGTILFPSAVPSYADPLVPILRQANYNTAGLVVPPAVPSFWDVTVLQLTMNGPNGGITFTDQKFGTNPLTVSNATTDNAYSVFGGSSAKFDGVSGPGGGIVFATDPKWDFLRNPFTIEGWFRTTTGQMNTELVAHSDGGFNSGSWSLSINSDGTGDGKINWYCRDYNGAVTYMVRSANAYNDGGWHHVAMVRSGNLWTLYVDGGQQGTVNSIVSLVASSYDVIFGNGHFFNRTLLGNLAMWRFLSGVAAYSGSSFIVPTAPFATS